MPCEALSREISSSILRLIKTMEEGTKILATVDGILRTVTESSLRRNLKLKDEEGISSLPDAELFENLTLMGMQVTHTHTYVVPFHTRKLFTTLRVNSPSFSSRIVPLFDTMLVPQGKGSGTPTESYHTPSLEAQQTSPTTQSSPTLPPVTTDPIPIVTPSNTSHLRQYTRRARVAQSSALPPVVDEPTSPLRDVSQGEACPTDSGFKADQDMANIAKTSTLPHESTSRVTSLAADEGSMQHKLDELTALCTSQQRQHSEMVSRFEAQELEINSLKARIKLLEDKDRGVVRELEEQMAREDQRMSEQIARDVEIARIHAKEELQIMIDGLDKNNETVAKYQDNYAKVHKYQSQQRKHLTKKQQREFYTLVLRNQARWKAKDFKGMTLEEIKENFDSVWKQIHDFIPIGSKEEAKRFKRTGIREGLPPKEGSGDCDDLLQALSGKLLSDGK
nr:hypothetical protein [Tanacetum cinerariifolium]